MAQPTAPDAHPLIAGLAAVAAGLAQAAGEGADRVWQLSTEDTGRAVQAALAAQAQLTAVVSALLTHAEATDVKQELSATSTAWWLASKQRITRAAANEHIRVAEALDRQPAARGLLSTGAATVEHAKSVARTLDAIDALGTVTVDDRATAVAFLTEQAGELDPKALDVIGRRLVEALTAAPDTDDPAEAAAVAREAAEPPADRCFTYSRDRDGTWSGRFKGLDALAGATLDGYLRHLLHPAKTHGDGQGPGRDANTAGADGGAGGSASGKSSNSEVDEACRDERTAAAKRLDGLAELLTAGAAQADLPGDSAGRAPVLLVTCDYDPVRQQLGSGQLEDGTRITAADLRLLACSAGILPAVMGGSSQPLDLGYARRLFSTGQRQALILRDRGCTFQGCERPGSVCQAHHRDYWEHGGPTDLDNGCLLCPYHHALVHRQGWSSRISPANGHIEWRPPPAIDPQQRWRQHHRFRIPELFG